MAKHSPQVTLPIDRERALGAVVVGRAGMDLYPEPDGATIAEATTFAAELGGSAGNIAVAIARQGVPAALLSTVSDDAVGRIVRAVLERDGVDTTRCRVVSGGPRTSLALAERPHRSGW
jgi:5-dehydro-2-deoxygluconokinase